MSEEAFTEKLTRAQNEVTAIEKILKEQRAVVAETEQALDNAHGRVRDAHRDLEAFKEAHKNDS